ncbi:hypothetical protein EDB83DRAFT_1011497 [Lactarius deliciosus]|nr:hypothetical protein EDB83DRAFT_1011497 [Lactarius deliciosus]
MASVAVEACVEGLNDHPRWADGRRSVTRRRAFNLSRIPPLAVGNTSRFCRYLTLSSHLHSRMGRLSPASVIFSHRRLRLCANPERSLSTRTTSRSRLLSHHSTPTPPILKASHLSAKMPSAPLALQCDFSNLPLISLFKFSCTHSTVFRTSFRPHRIILAVTLVALSHSWLVYILLLDRLFPLSRSCCLRSCFFMSFSF